MLREALNMSMATGGQSAPAASSDVDIGAMTEEEQIAYALQMSMQPEEAAASSMQDEPMGEAAASAETQQLVTDPDFLRQVLSNLPDVDPNSDAVKEAMGEKNKDNE